MKKAKTAVIIIAVIMVLVGGAVAFFGIVTLGFDFDKLATNETITHDYLINVDFASISVDSLIADVKITKSTDEKCRIASTENGKIKSSVTVADGILKIVQTDERKWYEKIGIFLGKTEIVISLPNSEYDSLHVTSEVGDLIVPSGFTFSAASVHTDTGDVEFYANVKNQLKASTDTGDVKISGSELGTLDAESDTGSVQVSSVTVMNDLDLSTDTGRVDASEVTCLRIIAKTSTGRVTLDDVLASGMMKIDTSTGAVMLDRCDAAEIYIQTSTGSVTGTLLSEKQFFTETGTGKVSVPPSGNGGRCEIETGTGNINIKIQ